jgi:endonuclease-3
MSVPNRSAILNATHKVLKKHYEPFKPPADRSVLEHLLYACCLENAQPEAADEAFARLQQAFFDWNEVRVTTVTELAEALSSLPDAPEAATRLKKSLQHIFETHYSYDIEPLKKQNLGKAVKELQGVRGTTPFVVSYVTQHGLGGHSIPVSHGTIGVLRVVGAVSDTEAKRRRVPGLERAISKAKGIEFASLLHQLGAEFHASPYSSKVRSIVLEINPEAKGRLPKRGAKADAADASAQQAEQQPAPRRKRKVVRPPEASAGEPEAPETRKRRKKTPAADAAPETTADQEKAGKETKGRTSRKTSPTKQLSKRKPR